MRGLSSSVGTTTRSRSLPGKTRSGVFIPEIRGQATKSPAVRRAIARKRLTQTTYDDSTTTTYSYDGPGNLAGVTDQASNTVNYTYDFANQLRSVVQTASPNPQNTTAYNYDVDGNLTTLTDANSHTTLNGFDLLNQLNAETLPAAPPTRRRKGD